ncbi:MAG: tryptophan 7-halogenase [Saprospiraceae bacterium]|nr:tryptophan 7-halogenase [Saprospiraceae bacterium]
MNEFDVIIIGGGPTGSSLATFLTREGVNVLVLEKEKFPREHVGESMLPYCYSLFDELGVLDEMKRRFSRKPGVTFSNPDGAKSSHWCFDKMLDGPESISFHARRAHFDEMMLNNSRKEGAEAWEEMQVVEADLQAPGGGVLVKAKHPEKGMLDIRAKFLVDASGQDCFLAKKLGIQKKFESLNVRLALSSHWENVHLTPSLANGNITIVHFGGKKLGWIWLIPLNDNRLSVGLAINMDYAQEQRQILMKEHGARKWQEAFYLQELSESPLVSSIIKDASMCWDVVSNGDFSYYASEKYGPTHAIVGDAAAFLDPIFSSGIYLGLKSAKVITPGIVQAIREGNLAGLQSGYELMENGYKVVEDLITAFYEPSAIHFPELAGSDGIGHEQLEAIYSVYHLLLAGDFFNQSERYRKAIASLRSANMIEKFRNLKDHSKEADLIQLCAVNAAMA